MSEEANKEETPQEEAKAPQEAEAPQEPQAEAAPQEEAKAEPKAEPVQGKVKWFSNVKGFGFLQKEGEDRDIFVHYSAISSEGYKTLKPDEEVTFEIVESDKGPQAANVVRQKKDAEAASA